MPGACPRVPAPPGPCASRHRTLVDRDRRVPPATKVRWISARGRLSQGERRRGACGRLPAPRVPARPRPHVLPATELSWTVTGVCLRPRKFGGSAREDGSARGERRRGWCGRLPAPPGPRAPPPPCASCHRTFVDGDRRVPPATKV